MTMRTLFPVPPGAPRVRCRSCRAEVIWILTVHGKRMPVDPDTRESHFATCPNADEHRKPRT